MKNKLSRKVLRTSYLISEVLEYYKNMFTNDFEAGNITRLGDTPSGNTEICEVKIFGQKYTLMRTSMNS
jgi:hypothetical protein